MTELGEWEKKVLARIRTTLMGVRAQMSAGVDVHDLDGDTETILVTAAIGDVSPGIEGILKTVEERLLMGQRQYALLNPATETRDLGKEQYEEGIDLIVYRNWQLELEEYRRGK